MPAVSQTNGEAILELRELSKSYGQVKAVRDLSLKVHAGEIFGLLGPNGAGKTTTINLISGFLKPEHGSVFLHGRPIIGPEGDFRTRIGVCPQENVIWKRLNPVEQLRFLGDMYGLESKEISSQIDLLIDALDLSEVTRRLGGQLSGGMQRRLSIALSLIHDPEIVILDEPEAGLDPQSRIKIRNFIKSLAGTKTVILSTHNMDEADRLTDRLAILDRGRLLIVDSPEALKATAGDGDVLEISFIELPAEFKIDDLYLSGEAEVLLDQNRLLIRAFDLPNLLPKILSSLDNLKLQPDDIRLRKNTLEDVFVQLTGRRLQE